MGLVTIPVALYKAVDDKSISFNLVHEKDKGAVRYKKVCDDCGEDLTVDDIQKAVRMDDQVLVFSDEELDMGAPSTKNIEITAMVNPADVDPMLFTKPYYMIPLPTGATAYKVIVRAMEETGMNGLAKLTLREREHPVMLTVGEHGIIVAQTMRWPDEVRYPEAQFLEAVPEPNRKHMALAVEMIEGLAAEFDPSEYTDEYRVFVSDLIDKKLSGVKIETPKVKEPQSTAGDLMGVLEASVAATRKAKVQKSKTKKTTAKKKTTKKKTTAKKTTQRRTRKSA